VAVRRSLGGIPAAVLACALLAFGTSACAGSVGGSGNSAYAGLERPEVQEAALGIADDIGAEIATKFQIDEQPALHPDDYVQDFAANGRSAWIVTYSVERPAAFWNVNLWNQLGFSTICAAVWATADGSRYRYEWSAC
jgi:hypothetical protein